LKQLASTSSQSYFIDADIHSGSSPFNVISSHCHVVLPTSLYDWQILSVSLATL